MTMFREVSKKLLSGKKKKNLTYTNTTNIAVFGASGVGKTQIINAFATSIYGKNPVFRPTITECYERKIILRSQDGTVCKHELSILDTAGNLRYDFPSVHKQAIQNSEAFILVFSLDDEASLNEMEYILQDIYAIKKSQNTPVLIIANKSDLVNSKSQSVQGIRNKLAHLNRGLCFEKSALQTDELNECFVSLLTKLEKRKGIDRSFYGVQIMC